MQRWPFELAHWIGVVPLAWMGWLALNHQRRSSMAWLLAAGFGVSWLADTGAHWVSPWIISAAYPVSQAALFGAALLPPVGAWLFLFVLVTVAEISIAAHGVDRPEVLLHTVAWLTIAWAAFGRWELGWLRTSLLVTFGGGLLAWYGYCLRPGWTTWSLLQGCRLAGTICFCLGASREH